ncbi:antitoxin of toxin-antitoxin stability system [Ectopseudomonas guguanensis]|uniref:antitoxin of toxin-antitoxin stability system n=1 Tax=Ectopseudomonas guguanensis TaxID=1198456 RepID=UPI0028B00524|nr:antitoxin of toxin-antitoxin stability system [Pseudomonas guguanensis]
MAKEAVFNLKLEPELREDFMAAAQAAHRPTSQFMRDFIRPQQQAKEHDEFVQRKVAAARTSIEAGRGRANDHVEAEFAARRAKALGH